MAATACLSARRARREIARRSSRSRGSLRARETSRAGGGPTCTHCAPRSVVGSAAPVAPEATCSAFDPARCPRCAASGVRQCGARSPRRRCRGPDKTSSRLSRRAARALRRDAAQWRVPASGERGWRRTARASFDGSTAAHSVMSVVHPHNLLPVPGAGRRVPKQGCVPKDRCLTPWRCPRLPPNREPGPDAKDRCPSRQRAGSRGRADTSVRSATMARRQMHQTNWRCARPIPCRRGTRVRREPPLALGGRAIRHSWCGGADAPAAFGLEAVVAALHPDVAARHWPLDVGRPAGIVCVEKVEP